MRTHFSWSNFNILSLHATPLSPGFGKLAYDMKVCFGSSRSDSARARAASRGAGACGRREEATRRGPHAARQASTGARICERFARCRQQPCKRGYVRIPKRQGVPRRPTFFTGDSPTLRYRGDGHLGCPQSRPPHDAGGSGPEVPSFRRTAQRGCA
jgi:hypothetical protein